MNNIPIYFLSTLTYFLWSFSYSLSKRFRYSFVYTYIQQFVSIFMRNMVYYMKYKRVLDLFTSSSTVLIWRQQAIYNKFYYVYRQPAECNLMAIFLFMFLFYSHFHPPPFVLDLISYSLKKVIFSMSTSTICI